MDKSLAARQIELLTGDAETPCNFRLIHDRDRHAPGRKLFGSLNVVWPEIAAGQAEGYGVFVVVNEGGDADADITKVRALYIDADGDPMPASFHLPPSFTVHRDETHWHAYWLCDDLPTDQFTQAQKRLIARYNSDKTINNLSRVMRLAGTNHHKGDPLPVTLRAAAVDPWERTYLAREITQGLPEPAPDAEIRTVAVAELDTPSAIARAVSAAERWPVLREGVGDLSDIHAVKFLGELGDIGLTVEKAAEVAHEHWGKRCGFDAEWILAKARSAYKSRQNALGVDAVQSPQEAFGEALTALLPPKPAFPKFYFYDEEEFANWQEPTWLIPGLIPERGITIWYGKPGSYKSFLALDTALRLAYGMQVFGHLPARPHTVLYIAGESPNTVAKWRVSAWKLGHDRAGQKGAFRLANDMPLIADASSFIALIEQIKAQNLKPELIIIDTVSTAMAGLDDSSFKDASNFMSGLRLLRDVLKCAVLAIHHTKKDGTDERGSGAFRGDADAMAEISSWGETKAVAITMKKLRDAELQAHPWTFQGKKIGNALVFYPTTPAEHAQLTHAADTFSRALVGKALLALGVAGRENAVRTAVVADELLPRVKTESAEQRKENIGRACSELDKLARTSLRAYSDSARDGVVWFLPHST